MNTNPPAGLPAFEFPPIPCAANAPEYGAGPLMGQAAVTPGDPVPYEQLSLRQLRHHTANVWQQVLCAVWEMTEAANTPEARKLGADIERRIIATAGVADAMFGFTQRPGRFRDRLTNLCRHTLAAHTAEGQSVALDLSTRGACPVPLQGIVLRVAQEMVANAVKHGLHARLRGRVTVSCVALPMTRVRLQVLDDGWGPPTKMVAGEGWALMRELAGLHAGEVTMQRDGDNTCLQLELPWPTPMIARRPRLVESEL